MIRLDKLLSTRGYCTRREARGSLDRVAVDGERPRTFDQRVDPARVTWDGEALDPEVLVVLLHKPAGLICSNRDRGGPLVFETLPDRWLGRNPGLSCVGRLDKDTTGALLLTDHGELLHRLTSPRYKLPKVYEVRLEREATDSELERIRAGGLVLDGEALRPAAVRRLGEAFVELTLTEGRYHQIKRTFAMLGNQVVALHRSRVADLELDGLAPGEYRVLEPARVLGLVGLG